VGKLFPLWKIPEEITAAITGFCHIADHKTDLDTNEKKLSFCIMLGNMLAKVGHYGRECDQFIWPVDNWMFEAAHMGNVISDKFVADIQNGIEQFRVFLGLDPRDYSADIQSPENASLVRIGIANIADHLFIPVERYLERKGYAVERITEKDTQESAEKKRFTMVIVWTGQSVVSDATITPYTKFLRQETGPEGDQAKAAMAPVLCIVPPDYAESNALPKEISIISNRIDLRELDQAIEQIIAGTPVRTLSASAFSPPKASPAAAVT
jgi:hypothetical protein